MFKIKVYYAHCMNTYGTATEKKDVALLERSGLIVVNPNSFEFKSKWAKYGMSFADTLIDKCQMLVFRRLNDGKISSGVGYEIKYAEYKNIPVLEIPHKNALSPILTREETKRLIYG